jgi:LPS sulfotransferase NodH
MYRQRRDHQVNATPTSAYVLCGTPRTGSTLVCTLLESTGVAGRPQSYFRTPDRDTYATTWGIPRTPDGRFTFADYLHGAITAGRSANGVFATRIMWGTLAEIIRNLRDLYADHASADRDLLTRAFGPTRFIYLRRRDVVAQAVSRVRAEQTNVWHIIGDVPIGDGPAVPPAHAPRYDFAQIHTYTREIEAHNRAWTAWFRTNGIQPHHVWYEDVAAAPVETTLRILAFLQLAVPPHVRMSASNQRLADATSTEWIARYHADLHTQGAAR